MIIKDQTTIKKKYYYYVAVIPKKWRYSIHKRYC